MPRKTKAITSQGVIGPFVPGQIITAPSPFDPAKDRQYRVSSRDSEYTYSVIPANEQGPVYRRYVLTVNKGKLTITG